MSAPTAPPLYDHAGISLHLGDCREVLAGLPDGCVQTCVTSPPYFGLRDYGTAEWEGGDDGCDHLMPVSFKSSTLGASTGGRSQATHQRSIEAQATPYRDICGKCGARRIDKQLGLEATPDEFVAALVAVFREVRRILRDDGTVWIVIGDSYAGGGGYSPDAPSNAGGNLNQRAKTFTSDKRRGPQASRLRLRQDLTPEQEAYVLAELAKARAISSAIQDGRP